MSEKKEDRRVRRTKKLIMQGLCRLMRDKNVNDITVRELADECDINRGTFYLYYKDVFDMMEQLENELLNRLNTVLDEQEQNIAAGRTRQVLETLFSLAEENQDLCRALLSPHGDIRFLERLEKVLRVRCREEWEKLHMNTDEDRFEMGYAFVIYGIIGLLRTWLNDPNPVPASRAAETANALLAYGVLSIK